MSTRDSTYSYVHIDDPNQVIYMEKWQDDPIPFDDIDTQQLLEATANLFPQLLLEEEEDGAIPIQPATYGAKAYKNRQLLKDKIWNDFGIFEKFLNESSSLNKQVDKTILGSMYTKSNEHFDGDIADGGEDIVKRENGFTVADYLSNGFTMNDNTMDILSPTDMANDSIMGVHHGDISLNSTSDLPGGANNTFFNARSNSIGYGNQAGVAAVQTPRVGRTRQTSTDKSFQTPITRIMR
ncbi:hypothetical protein PICST_28046 [Scheffersomyces stipitis CBS 6054]|uniref:Uncharacterized protein n=1 Tax=Scheffersomyces stipitis (strain ATCC 58785 / CBS 6054 / NBRC 10063 / NRRL Y-11545) TaxID=322104 RepID=A3GEY2_PICST|nr:predicted protein [Scheffersomyces stipitis CBS 6054]EAZ63663.1 hypothetical protein PICST_28046 [Scheffersomyces stipitis CBS 6054]KAG2731764.1 hypothetical protein G9P44_005351 [Scheffersomyces stipitis]